MEDFEYQNDNLMYEIFMEFGKNFIMLFDCEDIYVLVIFFDDIIDYIYVMVKKINFYKVDLFDEVIVKMVNVIYDVVIVVNQVVKELCNLKNMQKVIDCVICINSIENDVDDIFDVVIEKLFDSDIDVKDFIKKCEIFQIMEVVMDKCEDVGNVIEFIVVKYV